MSTHQQSLIQGEALVDHIDILEQMLEQKLASLRGLGPAQTESAKRYEHDLLIDLGLIASELRAVYSSTDEIPF